MSVEFTRLRTDHCFARMLTIVCAEGEQYAFEQAIKKHINIDELAIESVKHDSTFHYDVPNTHVEEMLSDRISKALKMAGGTGIGIGNAGFLRCHPSAQNLNWSQELIMLIDLDNQIKLTQSMNSKVPNYYRCVINNIRDLVAFADMIKFPSQGIVLKQMADGQIKNLKSNILTWDLLYTSVLQFSSNDTELVAETDMRIYLNPARMNLVEHTNALLWQKYQFQLLSTFGNRNPTSTLNV